MLNDRFDVNARVSTEKAGEWQRDTTSGYESAVFKHALEQLLADRFKLKAHTIPIEMDGYALEVERSGPTTKLISADKVPAHTSARLSRLMTMIQA